MNSTHQSHSGNDSPIEAEPLLDASDLKFLLRKDVFIFGLIVLACLALAGIWYASTPTLYKSSALIYIDPKFDQIIRYEKLGDGSSSDLPSLNSLEVALMADSMILRVLDRLDLRNDSSFLPEDMAAEGELPDLKLVKFLQQKRFSAGLIPDTRLIEITIKDSNPDRSVDIANAFVSEFDSFLIEKRQEEARETQTKLEIQATEARDSALIAEDSLRKFREENPETLVEQDGDLYASRLTQFSNELNSVVRQRLELESQTAVTEEVDLEKDPLIVIELAGYHTSTHVSDLLSHKMNADTKLAAASIQLTDSNPAYLAALNEKQRTEEQLLQLAKDIKSAGISKLAAIRNREEGLRNQLTELQGGLVNVKSLSSRFRALKQQVEREWNVHETLQQKISESLVAGESYSNIATEFSKPLKPYKKAEPRLLIILIIGLGLSAALCAGWAALRILRGLPYVNARQLSSRYRLPVVGNWTSLEQIPTPDESARFHHALTSGGAKITQTTAPLFDPVSTLATETAADTVASLGVRVLLIAIRDDPSQSNHLIHPAFYDSDSVARLEITTRLALKDGNLQKWIKDASTNYDHIFIDAGRSEDVAFVHWLSSIADQNIILISKGTASKSSVDEHIEYLSGEGMPPSKLLMTPPFKARRKKPTKQRSEVTSPNESFVPIEA